MNYEIEQKPVYVKEIRRLENSDPANAETIFNPLFSRIINNVEAVKQTQEENNESVQVTLSNILHDISTLSFKLAIRGYVDTIGMKQVVVDKIDTQNDVQILSGHFDSSNKKVYI